MIAHRYILLVGTIKPLNFKCGFGNIYAPSDDRERQAFWEELGTIINSMEILRFLGGDFNSVRSEEEKNWPRLQPFYDVSIFQVH